MRDQGVSEHVLSHVSLSFITLLPLLWRYTPLHLMGSPFWTLQVESPRAADSGVYECQVSTQPKMYRRFVFLVVVPSAEIQGTQQVYMKTGSDINITCVVSGHLRDSPITWYYSPLNQKAREVHAAGRGGVQLVTDKHAGTSWLLVDHATWRDAGNYTCAPMHARPASVVIHVVDEESPAAMQHDSGSAASPLLPSLLLLLLLAFWGAATSQLGCHYPAAAWLLPLPSTHLTAT
ncbi:hypothetical protein O3P69_016857 [Scylla paramamosain]|uniref:Ig-like domain-containing protein n=1 Tax=Scylla paramamosain TaxID=85552 RepID=A0AAW0T036_SCYPA